MIFQKSFVMLILLIKYPFVKAYQCKAGNINDCLTPCLTKEFFTSTELSVLKLSLITWSGIPRLYANLLTARISDGIDMSGESHCLRYTQTAKCKL